MDTFTVRAKAGDTYVDVLLDADDAERLGTRKLSIGSHGYAQIWAPGVMLLHRWIMQVPVGTGYQVIVDHINRDKLDCRKANLRIVTPTESNLNRALPKRDLPTGVYRARNKRYVAHLKRRGKQHNLGTFDTPEQAAAAVLEARRELDPPEFITAATRPADTTRSTR